MNMIRNGSLVESKDAVIGRKLHDLGATLCFFGLNDMGTYFKEISNSPKSVTLFFEMVTAKIKRGSQPPIPPSRAEIFTSFKKDDEMLSEEQVTKLVNLTRSWDTDDKGLEDLKASAHTWLSTPGTFFDSSEPSLTGNDGLIEFCFDSTNHIKDTSSTRRKLDTILLDNALKYKEECLREKYENGKRDSRSRYKTNRSKAIDEFTYRRFGDLPKNERKTKYHKMKMQRISGSKWDQIKPRWMILALKDAKTTCFETKKLEPIEISAINAYIPHLKAYKYGSILKLAYSSILLEYKRRSQREDEGGRSEGDCGLEWIDSLLDSTDVSNNSLSGVESTFSPLTGVDDTSDAGLPTPDTSSQWESYAETAESTPANNPSPRTNLEQSGHVAVESRYSADFVTGDGSSLQQTNRNMTEKGHELSSGWSQAHDARDADAADALSQLHSTRVLPEASYRTVEPEISTEPVISPSEQGPGMEFAAHRIPRKRPYPENELRDPRIHPFRRSSDNALCFFDANSPAPAAVQPMGESCVFDCVLNPNCTDSVENPLGSGEPAMTSASSARELNLTADGVTPSSSWVNSTTILIPGEAENFTVNLDALQDRANGEQDTRTTLNAGQIVDCTIMSSMVSHHDPSLAATPSLERMVMDDKINEYDPGLLSQVIDDLLNQYEYEFMGYPILTS